MKRDLFIYCTTQSLYRTPETNMTLYINYTSIKKVNEK